MNSIKVHGKNSTILDVDISQILTLVSHGENYFWNLLWLEGVGENILEFEREVKRSLNGYSLTWDELLNSLTKISSINEFLLIGDDNRNHLKRFESDDLMRGKCRYCIELIDSSYWLISSADEIFMDKIKAI